LIPWLGSTKRYKELKERKNAVGRLSTFNFLLLWLFKTFDYVNDVILNVQANFVMRN